MAELRDKAAGVHPWAYYIATVVHFDVAGLVGVVEPFDGEQGDAHPPLGPLHVITAVQPDSDSRSDDNAERLRALDEELFAAGLRIGRAEGSSADGRHREASRAVFGLEDSEARAIGRRFGQVAIFAWRGPRWSLLACASERETHRPWRWRDSE